MKFTYMKNMKLVQVEGEMTAKKKRVWMPGTNEITGTDMSFVVQGHWEKCSL